MKNTTSKSRFWTILAVVNLLMLAYPISMWFAADTQEGIFVAVIAVCGIGLILGIADIISVLLAYSCSY